MVNIIIDKNYHNCREHNPSVGQLSIDITHNRNCDAIRLKSISMPVDSNKIMITCDQVQVENVHDPMFQHCIYYGPPDAIHELNNSRFLIKNIGRVDDLTFMIYNADYMIHKPNRSLYNHYLFDLTDINYNIVVELENDLFLDLR